MTTVVLDSKRVFKVKLCDHVALSYENIFKKCTHNTVLISDFICIWALANVNLAFVQNCTTVALLARVLHGL